MRRVRAEGGQITGEGRQAYQGSAEAGEEAVLWWGEARSALSHQLGARRAVARAWKCHHSASCFHAIVSSALFVSQG